MSHGPPDMGPIVDRFGVPVTFTNYGVSTKDANNYKTPGAKTTVSGKAHIYPLDGKKMQDLPEGQRSGELWAGGTITEVFATTEGGSRGTEVGWAGRVLEVIKIQQYTGEDGTGGYYEFAARTVTR